MNNNSNLQSPIYKPIIGLEVHVELKTNSKMFCGCDNKWFAQEPNTHTCPVCLGLPGALPVPNKKAIEWCIKIGIALNCEIPLFSKFDRKNYFYPDLPKGYQISQYDQPFAINGWMDLGEKGERSKENGEKKNSYLQSPDPDLLSLHSKRIRIRRVHMEEDTAKLTHQKLNGQSVSLVDFNRSGVPLVEIVTEPDFDNANDVKEYLQRLQQIVRYLGVSDADMEKGQMRLEPNISLRKENGVRNKEKTASLQSPISNLLPNYKVEVKNINSFSFVEKAINFEVKRQQEILENGETPKQETRGWHEQKQKTVSQRSKEEAMDYRYFPEPDIPPFHWTNEFIQKLRNELPELPDIKLQRFIKEYHLPMQDAEILTKERALADFYEETVKENKEVRSKNQGNITPKTIANWIINKKIDIENTVPAEVIRQIAESQKIESISDEELMIILKKVLHNNSKAVEEYKKGKETVIMFFVGQSMKELRGKAKADVVKEKLLSLLHSL